MVDTLNPGGKKIILNRSFKSSPDYTTISRVKFGTNSTTTYTESSTEIDNPVPIEDGTVLDDGSNTLTGSSGADNSTDNTSTFKPGAGQSDVTAQNLIKNDTNATAIWTISNLATAGTNATADQYTGLWIYIKDATALAKFVTSGTCLEIKLGSDSSNYYSITYETGDLSTGWNWLPIGILNSLTETGTVSGNIDTFIIEITTNNATDTFVAGDVVYDLLRQWEETDMYINLSASYPLINETEFKVDIRTLLGSSQAVGFNLDVVAFYNTDGSVLMYGLDTFDESKSDTDEFEITRTDGF